MVSPVSSHYLVKGFSLCLENDEMEKKKLLGIDYILIHFFFSFLRFYCLSHILDEILVKVGMKR